MCLRNLSSDWTAANSANTGLYGKVYDFVVDYEAIDGVRQIYDMHRYLMTKHIKCIKYEKIHKILLISLALSFFNIFKVKSLECMSMINQNCMTSPKIVDTNANEPVF